LSGGPGAGKTTIALHCNPARFATSEQQVEMAHRTWVRVVKQHEPSASVPLFSAIGSWIDLEEDLIGIQEGELVIVDSISQLALSHETVGVVKKVVEKIQEARARAIFIAQHTKDGDMLGPNQLRHLVDVVADIPPDNAGIRRLSISKNRFGGLFAQYFALEDSGVTHPDFPYAYSVEGPTGNYSLHLYPNRGAKLAGIFKDLDDKGLRISESASAAIRCNLYEEGYAEPVDASQRKKFAELHGLTWIDPITANNMIAELDPED